MESHFFWPEGEEDFAANWGGGNWDAESESALNAAEGMGRIRAGDFGEPHSGGACDHEGQCVLLAIWGDLSLRMKSLLDAYTLADLSDMTEGRAEWPGDQR